MKDSNTIIISQWDSVSQRSMAVEFEVKTTDYVFLNKLIIKLEASLNEDEKKNYIMVDLT